MFATIIDYVVSVVTQTINLLGVPVVINELAELYTEHKYSFKWLHRHPLVGRNRCGYGGALSSLS